MKITLFILLIALLIQYSVQAGYPISRYSNYVPNMPNMSNMSNMKQSSSPGNNEVQKWLDGVFSDGLKSMVTNMASSNIDWASVWKTVSKSLMPALQIHLHSIRKDQQSPLSSPPPIQQNPFQNYVTPTKDAGCNDLQAALQTILKAILQPKNSRQSPPQFNPAPAPAPTSVRGDVICFPLHSPFLYSIPYNRVSPYSYRSNGNVPVGLCYLKDQLKSAGLLM